MFIKNLLDQRKMKKLNKELLTKNKRLKHEVNETKELKGIVIENRRLSDENDKLENIIKDIQEEINSLIHPNVTEYYEEN